MLVTYESKSLRVHGAVGLRIHIQERCHGGGAPTGLGRDAMQSSASLGLRKLYRREDGVGRRIFWLLRARKKRTEGQKEKG